MKANSKTIVKTGKGKIKSDANNPARSVPKRGHNRLLYFASLIDNISDALISTDMEFKVLTWNSAAENIYGWTAAEVIGRPQIGRAHV